MAHLDLSERELTLLRLAMHMADEESGWEYPDDLDWNELKSLYKKIGGKPLTKPVNNGAYDHYLQDPRYK